jgi:pyruvate dehydrogenase E2 component (dihydrolipoamide acetyltransferase)
VEQALITTPETGGAATSVFPPSDACVRRPISEMRRVIADRMYRSHSEIPSVTHTVKVDVTELLEMRDRINQDGSRKISINDLVLKATCIALREHPNMLVSIDGNEIIQYGSVNLAIAVALADGLVVPVIKGADRLGLSELSEQAAALASAARENRLLPDDYKGSNFTVSNIGMYAVESFTPIINQPDAAILGVCAVEEELTLNREDRLCRRKKMRLSLTYDHRLLDGATAARFQLTLKNVLENPVRVLL